MCRGDSKFCTKLGTDPEKWSRKCPLPPPVYFEESLNYFIESYKLALMDQKDEAIAVLQKTRSDELREWYVEHGSYSGHKHRVNLLKSLCQKSTQANVRRKKISILRNSEKFISGIITPADIAK